MRAHGNKDYVVYEGDRLTFADAIRASSTLAYELRDRYGVKKGDRVAIGMRNYPEWIFAFTAITSIGAIAVAMVEWGSPGGAAIIHFTAKTLIGALDWGLDPQRAIDLPNFGSRNGPTELEAGTEAQGWKAGLEARGHEVRMLEMTSGIQAIVLTPRAQKGTGMYMKAVELAQKHGWFLARQFENLANPAYHRNTTGPEILSDFAGKRLDAYRRDQIGFVFQAFNLIASLTARENIAVPLTLTGMNRKGAFVRADELLEQVNLSDRGHHLPSRLSGGQQQRVAVARGLGHNPPLLLADEPTANLDHIQAEAIIRLLQGLRDDGRMIIVSTHDSRLVPIADRIVQLIPVGGHDEIATHEVTYAAGESLDPVTAVIPVLNTVAVGSQVIFVPKDSATFFTRSLGTRSVASSFRMSMTKSST